MGTPEATDDEAPVQVTFSKGYWLATTETTQGQYTAVMGTTPWKGQSFVKEGADYAASYVSWDDGVKFCETLSTSERKAAASRGNPGSGN